MCSSDLAGSHRQTVLELAKEHHIPIDFGCGNGTLSMRLAKQGLRVRARDVSWSSVAGTAVAAEVNGLEVDATWGDGLDGYDDASFDAIVTNPPFHQGVAKDTTDTLRMFDDAARVLRPGGRLWCVFNSHLPYRKELNVRLGRTQVDQQMQLAQDRLMDRRNEGWIAPIENAAAEAGVQGKAIVVGFGALHLPGEHGVLRLLERAGWTISPINVEGIGNGG